MQLVGMTLTQQSLGNPSGHRGLCSVASWQSFSCTLSKSGDEEDELEEEEFCTRWPTVLFCFCTGGVVISCPRWATAWSSPEPWAWQEGKLNAPGPLPSMHRLGRAGARVAAGSCSSCWRHAAREAELWLDKVCILQW